MMSGAGAESSSGLRDRLLLDFAQLFGRVRVANPGIHACIGRGINIAHDMLVLRFGSTERFQAAPDVLKAGYIHILTQAHARFAERWPTIAVGFALYRLWLEALAAGDAALAQHFQRGLAGLSIKSNDAVHTPLTAAATPGFAPTPAIDRLAA
jgi:hypothetical protein